MMRLPGRTSAQAGPKSETVDELRAAIGRVDAEIEDARERRKHASKTQAELVELRTDAFLGHVPDYEERLADAERRERAEESELERLRSVREELLRRAASSARETAAAETERRREALADVQALIEEHEREMEPLYHAARVASERVAEAVAAEEEAVEQFDEDAAAARRDREWELKRQARWAAEQRRDLPAELVPLPPGVSEDDVELASAELYAASLVEQKREAAFARRSREEAGRVGLVDGDR